MAPVDAYSPCPCGSGQKFKWCCHKAESYVDRAQRLERNGQYEAALGVLNEGLVKHPDNAWLRIRKAVSLTALEKPTEARACLEELIQKQPNHLGAVVLNFRLLLESGEVSTAVAQFQGILSRAEARNEPKLGNLAAILGIALFRSNRVPAGLRHLEFAKTLLGDAEAWLERSLTAARSNAMISAWLKNPYQLAPCPESAGEDVRRRFEEALGWAREGLWEHAASAFELLTADRAVGPQADLNLGLCRLWLGDEPAAVAAIRRGIAAASPSDDVVDLEALCQALDDSVGDDPVEEVQLTWPLRDRAGLVEILRKNQSCVEDVDRDADAQDGTASTTTTFLLLDRPRLVNLTEVKAADLPLVTATIVVGADSVKLDTYDDGRLNGVIDQFTVMADKTIPPAHPRTKVVGSVSRADLVLDVACYPPSELPEQERQRLSAEVLRGQIETRWPETPVVYLDGKTPLSAAKTGAFQVPLRAALLLLEESGQRWAVQPDWTALRARVGLVAEPALDPIDVDIEAAHLGRLKLIDPKGLEDDRLIQLYEKAHAWGLATVVGITALEISERRRLLERDGFPMFDVFNDLAMKAVGDADRQAALAWVAKGREAEPASRRAGSAPAWDMLGIQVRMALDTPEEWVPDLVAVMDRYEGNQAATRVVLSRLVQLGLLRLVPSPDDPEEMAVDPTLLHHLITRFGPRVQTVGGRPGAPGELWTPGSQTEGGGIWTPGSQAAPAVGAEKPRLILPGQ